MALTVFKDQTHCCSNGADGLTVPLSNLRQRHIPHFGNVLTNNAGHFFAASEHFCDRLTNGGLTQADLNFLRVHGHVGANDGLRVSSQEFQYQARITTPNKLNYLILVPTLRCNLSCSYCQVSRVGEDTNGYDWTDETLGDVIEFIDALDGSEIKIEFQGGEPTLRLDIISNVIAACDRFEQAEFVICTNLAHLMPELIALLRDERVYISTSLDGSRLVHQQQRTSKVDATDRFFDNLAKVVEQIGIDRVSALPTIDQRNPPEPQSLIDSYASFGFSHLFLRPINYQGFARKRHPSSGKDHGEWWSYYDRFIDALIERNHSDRTMVLEETYLSLCLKRIFRLGVDGHVDLRNPNPVGIDYLVIDHDGAFYPTDEARMLTRSGVVDLTMGHVRSGIDRQRQNLFNANASNFGDPECDRCTYQPYCGRDFIDDLSRYGRIDLPRHESFFCQKHLHIFDLCKRLIYSEEAAVQYSLAKWLGLAGDALPLQPYAS